MYNANLFDKLQFKPRHSKILKKKYKFSSDRIVNQSAIPEYILVAENRIYGMALSNRTRLDTGNWYVLELHLPLLDVVIIPFKKPANLSFFDTNALSKILAMEASPLELTVWRKLFERGETHQGRQYATRYRSHHALCRETALVQIDGFNVWTSSG